MSTLSSPAAAAARPLPLKLFDGQAEDPAPSSTLTLTQFFRTWFLEQVLEAQERKASTATLYEDALAYWRQFTGDPPIAAISQAVVNQFREAMKSATWRRGRYGQVRPLSRQTAGKHLGAIRALLKALGPQTQADRPAAGFVERVPLLAARRPKPVPKDCFSIEQLRRLVATSRQLEGQAAAGVPMRAFWPACYAVLFYTGVRRTTGLLLQWEWMRQKKGESWLRIPDEAVPKTDKGKEVVVHPLLLEACGRIGRGQAGPLLPWDHSPEHLLDLHYRIQTLAGLAAGEQLDLQALRRTHASEIFELGSPGLKAAQESLDHADARTTAGHYVQTQRLLLRLPALWSPQQVLF